MQNRLVYAAKTPEVIKRVRFRNKKVEDTQYGEIDSYHHSTMQRRNQTPTPCYNVKVYNFDMVTIETAH